MSILEKAPPHSLEAEMAVLGCMMIEKEALELAAERLVPGSFYAPKNGKLFEIFLEMARAEKTVDILTVAAELRQREMLVEIGGADYLARMIEEVPTAAHIEDYVRMVREEETLRSLVTASTRIIQRCHAREEEPREILDIAEKEIFDVADREVRQGVQPIAAMIPELQGNIEKLYENKRSITGIPTGFRYFDQLTTGLQPGNLVMLAARPGVGKTALALNIVKHVAVDRNIPTIFYSLEMSQHEIGMRLVSLMADVHLQRIRTGFLKNEEMPIVNNAMEELYNSQIFLDFSSSGLTAMSLRGSARRVAGRLRKDGKKLGLIVIDYIQLMRGSGTRRGENRQAEVSEISRSVKSLAMELNIPILALSQLNRSTEERGRDGRPQLADLRESGSLEQDSDLVAFIWREAMYKKDPPEDLLRKAKLIIAKQRNGPTGDVHLTFLKEYARFVDAELNQQEATT